MRKLTVVVVILIPQSHDGRGGGIRTHGLFVPNEARYQTALRPDIIHAALGETGWTGVVAEFCATRKRIF